jgi:type IV pilus assembly protein PilQ
VRSISIEGSGTVFTLRATPVGGYPLRPPLVSADGRNVVLSFAAPLQATLQTTQRNSLAPGAVANPNLVPPLRARATAPPVGDMAVGTMVLKNPNHLNVRGPKVTLTFKGVPASNALQALARLGGYGFVYNVGSRAGQLKTGGADTSGGQKGSTSSFDQANPPVTASFVNEDYRTAISMVLATSDIQAKLNGNTIIAGRNVLMDVNTGNQISKVYRLNQVSAKSAAEYLASLGAIIRVPNTQLTTESKSNSTGSGGASGSPGTLQAGGATATNISATTAERTLIEQFGGEGGPLTGLGGTTDTRLGTLTLVGIPSLVSIAEQYLKQIDLRQRQVALSIRILDVTLDNDTTIDNSFAFRYGNNFIVNQQGSLVANFGALKPPASSDAGLPGLYDALAGSPIVGAGSMRLPGAGGPPFLNQLPPSSQTPFYDPNYRYRPSFGTYTNPAQPGLVGFEPGKAAIPAVPDRIIKLPDGSFQFIQGTPAVQATPDKFTSGNPAAFQYPPNQFFDFLKAQILSGSTKVLASPTLILSENNDPIENMGSGAGNMDESNFLGSISTNNLVPTIGRSRSNESAVVVGERIVTGYSVQPGQNGAPNSCQPEFGIAGLTFGAKISKIDDNGFVTFTLSPTISARSSQENIPGCGPVALLTIRSLDTGRARVRDGQTLILTGVLSDRDLQLVSKWPVLGDLPIVGQFFRTSIGSREKRELVVMVTPRIINDTEGGSYGYGFEPTSRDSRRFMNSAPSSSIPSPFTQP